MRIEIDTELANALDKIKQAESTIYGRGHSETVRFLANYYHTHKPLQALLEDINDSLAAFLENLHQVIETAMEKAVLKAMRHAIASLFETKDENRTVVRSPDSSRQPEEGR